MLRVWLCGRVGVELDGQALELPTSERARALLGWLALHPGAHPRSQVAAQLWPDVPEASARASLRTAVWSLRKSWGPWTDDVLVGSRTTIGLRPQDLWLDAAATLDEDGDPPSGDLLPGVDDEWARVAREEHRDAVLALAQRRMAAAEELEDWSQALRWARQRCALAPLDESAHRDLLRLLDLAGERPAAVLAGREFSDRLRRELGVLPSPATRAVQSQVAAASHTSPTPTLFGRAGELAAASAVWSAAADGRGQVLVLGGEAGIGKSSVVAELARRVGAKGAAVALCAGSDVGGQTPFAAWLELARSLVGVVDAPPATASWPADLNRLSRELGGRLGHREPPAALAAPEIERLRIFEAVLRLVEWSCARRPLLIALDDAHRADLASLSLTTHVGRRIARLPVLLLLTRRDRPARPELDALLADLSGRAVPVTELELGPVPDRDVAAMARAVGSLGDDDARRVVAAAEGNPLLAVESARALSAGSSGPPPNLRTAVRAMTGALPPSGKELASLLAASGRALSRKEIERLGVSDLPIGEAAGLELGLLAWRQGRLGYRHTLLAEAAEVDATAGETLHERLAAAIDPDDHAGVARHLELAGRGEQAAAQWAAAGVAAREVGALDEAATFLRRATELDPGNGRWWLDLQEVWCWAARPELVDEAWAQALRLLPPAELPAAWCARGRLKRSVACDPQASFAAYQRAGELLDDESDPLVRKEMLIGLAWGQAVAGDPSQVPALLAGAGVDVSGAGLERDPLTLTDIEEIRLLGLVRQGRFAESADVARRAGPLAMVARLPGRAWALWGNASCAAACSGDLPGALDLIERAVEATSTQPVLLIPCLAGKAHLLARMGRHDEAARTVQLLRERVDRLDVDAYRAMSWHDEGLVALAGGRYAAAARLIGQALDAGAEISRPAARMARAEALARDGRPDEAVSELRAALTEPTGRADQPFSLVPRLARVQGLVAKARGDRDLARRRLEESAAGWERLNRNDPDVSEAFFGALVDLGRPPVVGLVDPEWELARVRSELAELSGLLDLDAATEARTAEVP
ncbi:ATP-binding protein [Angustibacter sp. McL0619]|uniref:ATP-binding protein n=1 Tax=Angustibacter sp. McL0619 TaxID=3415676 RepID=UPI003CF220BB